MRSDQAPAHLTLLALLPQTPKSLFRSSSSRRRASYPAASMRLYHCAQVPQTVGLRNWRDRACWVLPPFPQQQQQQQTDREPCKRDGQGDLHLIQPRRLLLCPALTPRIHRSLHQELLLCYRRGLLPRKRPELQCVLERRHREERERRERPLSDLDRHLLIRKLQGRALDSEAERRRRQSVPEFVRVKGALKHIPGFCL